ncbi:MAG: hypothetical protein ABL901_12835 [Hyphomicrobiaceae bacterium]
MLLFLRVVFCCFAGFLFAGLAFGMVPLVQAAEFQKRDYSATNDPSALDFAPRCNIQMTEEIVGPDPNVGQVGDYERAKIALEAFLRDPERLRAAGDDGSVLRPAGGFYALCLSSEGGDLREALRIATLFQDHWMMVVEPGQVCGSACAVLFMQAKRRDGIFSSNLNSKYPGRYLHHEGSLWFHAPALIYPKTDEDPKKDGENAATAKGDKAGAAGDAGKSSKFVSTDEAEEAYRQALISVEALLPNEAPVLSAPLASTEGKTAEAVLDDFGSKFAGSQRSDEDFPAKLLVKLLTTPNSDAFYIKTLGEAHEFGVTVWGLPLPKQLTDRMVMSACAAVAHARCQNSMPRGQCRHPFEEDSALVARSNMSPAQVAAFSAILSVRLQLAKSAKSVEKGDEIYTAEDPIERQQAMLKRWRVERTTLWPLAKAQGNLHAEAVAVGSTRSYFGSATIPCAVVAHWDGDLLVDLELQTRNGLPRHFLMPVSDDLEFILKESQLRQIIYEEKIKQIQRLDRTIDLDTAKKQIKDDAKLIADLKKLAAKSTEVKLNIPVQDSMGVAEAWKELDALLVGPETESRLAWYKMLPVNTPLKEITDDVWSWYEQGNAIGPPISGVAARKAPSSLQAVPPLGTAADTGKPAAKVAISQPAQPSDAAQRTSAAAFNIKGWARKVEATRIVLTSPPIGGKEGVTLEFWTQENAVEKGGMEPWFKERIDRWLGGRTIHKRQGLMRKGPKLWIDAVSLPNAQKKGGILLLFNSWEAGKGVQFVVETLPEHVGAEDQASYESEALISTLSTLGVELTPGIIRAAQQNQ